ncbi:hypothetical protein GCM10027413_29200 [Conyzicola nivalis]|uniref:DUF3027 domain-containing protein n=1 Tax=Conyzicola nivalis TaxID=1477021 RepID=A0A916WN57_9MICO|nr:DUF3027 domain-containing protein [Conyzicola nivalis]GGB13795.1 hypothetical protein GCM10010979_30310 [Conyzicola nivalis]
MPESTKFDVAYAALLEITPVETVGDPAGEVDEGDGVVSVLFECAMPGYPGWKWTVSVASLEGAEPSVLEVELMPAEGALLSPDWVPWSDRLAEYKAAQIAAGEEVDDADDTDEPDDDTDDDADETDDDESDDEEADEDDDDDDEDDDDDDHVIHVVHGGDVDGIDIDELDLPEPEAEPVADDEK